MEEIYISVARVGGIALKVSANDHAVIGIYPIKDEILSNENTISHDAASQLREYLVNIRTEFDFPIEMQGTSFQMDVWNALRQIPYGHTISYGELAAMIGRPKAVRAVGQAVGRNPCLIAVPCHRVLGKNGSLTGFSAGLELKKHLLRLENIFYREDPTPCSK